MVFLQPYGSASHDNEMSIDWFPLILSLKVATIATVISGLFGVAIAWVLVYKPFKGSTILEAFLMLPLVLPPTVLGYGILIAAGRHSPIGAWLRAHIDYTLIFNWHGAVVAASLASLPLVLKSAITAFAQVDHSLEAVASTLRQSPLSIFLRVTLPLAWPGILAGGLLGFARAMGEFGASLMVAGSIPGQTQTLSMAIYDASQAGHDDLAGVLVIVVSVLSITILVLSNHFLGQSKKIR